MRSVMQAILIALTLTCLVVMAMPLPSQAAITPRVKKACSGDYKRLCPRYKVGSPQLRACMEAKSSEISSACISALIDAGEVGKSSARR